MLANLNDVLPRARREGYAVGLFNTVNLEMARGVLAAAEEARSPVIIGTAEVLLPAASLEELSCFLLPMAEKASVPVVVHFDHGLTAEKTRLAMDLGFTSIMYDCSTMGFEENCKAVAEMVKEAHSRGISVEAELGHVGSNESAAEASPTADTSAYTDPEEARRFVEATGADALAVSIGTAHGAYRAAPKLQLELLRKIAEVVPVPLVMHGGSGLSDDDFRNAIRDGMAKVNIFTDLNCACAKAAHDFYQPGCGMTDLIPHLTEAVKAATLKKMKLFGCVGRA